MATSARPVALITGASAGIGAALAREAASDGHDLVLVARRREPMEALATELKSTGEQITIIPADLSRPGAAIANMQGAAIFEGPMPVMTAAEVARQVMRRLRPGVRRS
jgi:short-subunit dehydrogenase